MDSEIIAPETSVDPSPVVETPAPVVERAEPTSIADHAKQFSQAAQREAAETPTPADDEDTSAEIEKPIHHAEIQRREQETGKFQPGKRRGAKKTVERINTLTGRAKTAEEQLAAERAQRTTLEAELAQLRQAQTPKPAASGNGHVPIETRPAPVARVSDPNDPEPQETDPQFGGDPMKYLDARFRWAARDEHRQLLAHQQRQHQETSINMAFGERVDKAKAKYEDLDRALEIASGIIPNGSLIDQVIMTDDKGPDVLYHFASHPEEVGAILRLPPFEQVKRLALLSQRFASPPSPPAGATGAAATPQVRYLPSRPPTPVRTQAQGGNASSASTAEPSSIADHRKQFAARSRR